MRIPLHSDGAAPRLAIRAYHSCDEACADGARILADGIRANPGMRLGLATGSSPVGIYDRLIAEYKSGRLSFAGMTTVNLDEYVGLDEHDPHSYAYYMREHLFDHVDIPLSSTGIPNGMAEDLERECAEYDRILDPRPTDIQLLGIGRNGHVGFNEPGDAFIPDTHVVDLAQDTIRANSRFFTADKVQPTRAITMGIRGILNAKKLVLLAFGESKADAIYSAVFGPVTPKCPASVIQLHSQVVICVDHAALSRFSDDELRALTISGDISR